MTDISKEAVELLAAVLPDTNWRAPRLDRAASTLRALSARITELEAQLATAREREAGAYEAAAVISETITTSQRIAHDMRCGVFPSQSGLRDAIAGTIRALTPADATAALAARDARVREELVPTLAEALWLECEGKAVQPLYDISHQSFVAEYEAKARAILALRTPTEGTPE